MADILNIFEEISLSLILIIIIVGTTLFFYFNEKKLKKNIQFNVLRKQYNNAMIIGLSISILGIFFYVIGILFGAMIIFYLGGVLFLSGIAAVSYIAISVHNLKNRPDS